jgi:hypothetical protein
MTAMNLRLITPGAALVAALVLASASYAQPGAICQRATLLDVQEDNDYIPTVQVGRVYRNGSKRWTTVEMPSARRQTTYTVKLALNGIIYTARSSGDFWGYNPTKMVVGSEVEACAEANRLVITRHDGKPYKPTITRRELDQPVAAR